MKKIFLITIDTEGDNQWDNTKEATTKNVEYLPRFQEMAEKYEFKPTWLTNYEMCTNPNFVEYFKKKQNDNLCEIGMHLHAWNTPPLYELKKVTNERSYIMEYPNEIIEKKVKNLTSLLTEKFGRRPISHRSGRWVLNDDYLEILDKYGYKIDCSVTPGINWSKARGTTGAKGTDYRKYSKDIYNISKNIIEIPMTIRKNHTIQMGKIKNMKTFLIEIKSFIFGRKQWIRPDWRIV